MAGVEVVSVYIIYSGGNNNNNNREMVILSCLVVMCDGLDSSQYVQRLKRGYKNTEHCSVHPLVC